MEISRFRGVPGSVKEQGERRERVDCLLWVFCGFPLFTDNYRKAYSLKSKLLRIWKLEQVSKTSWKSTDLNMSGWEKTSILTISVLICQRLCNSNIL